MRLLLVFTVLAALSCAHQRPHQQLSLISKQDYGHLHRALDGRPLDAPPTATPPRTKKQGAAWSFATPMGDMPITFLRREAADLCFELPLGKHNTEETEQVELLKSRYGFALQTWGDLAEITPELPWPDPQAGRLTHVPGDRLKAEVGHAELCLAAPGLSDATNFVTMAVMPADNKEMSYLLIWDFNGRPR